MTAYAAISRSQTGATRRGQDESQMVLFHEYVHHLMHQYESKLYPSWYSEGIADYLSTTTFNDQTIVYGQVNGFRAPSLEADRGWTDYADILAPLDNDGKLKKIDVYDFYAQSWILTHYMLSDPVRSKQLRQYFQRLTIGEPSVQAFEAATGLKVKDLPGASEKVYRPRALRRNQDHRSAQGRYRRRPAGQGARQSGPHGGSAHDLP